MNMKLFYSVATLILIAALGRLIPHWPNFTPILGMAIFAGVAISNRFWSMLIPIAAMVISDLVLGAMFGTEYLFHSTQLVVYGSIVLVAAYGRLFTNASVVKTTFLGGTVSALAFYLITNTAVWLDGTLYPSTIDGLGMALAAGLQFYPNGGNFLLNGVVSTWISTAILLTVYAAIQRIVKKTETEVTIPSHRH